MCEVSQVILSRWWVLWCVHTVREGKVWEVNDKRWGWRKVASSETSCQSLSFSHTLSGEQLFYQPLLERHCSVWSRQWSLRIGIELQPCLLPPKWPGTECLISPPVKCGCSWGSQGKNTEVVCHSLLQWTAFCQNSPPWPVHLGWPYMAWLIVLLN